MFFLIFCYITNKLKNNNKFHERKITIALYICQKISSKIWIFSKSVQEKILLIFKSMDKLPLGIQYRKMQLFMFVK